MLPQPRKRFGQHFLHDETILARIVAACDPRPGQAWLEIGPGRGALTRHLLPHCDGLNVLELDRDLAAHLRASFGEKLTVVEGDALKFDFATLVPASGKLHVVGNLPYNISTPLLFHLFSFAPSIERMVFMLQKEVVDRLAASPGDKHYGRLSVMARVHCEVEPLFEVPPGAFDPPPKVDSAVLRLIPHLSPPYAIPDPKLFARLVAEAFGQRRKTLRNSLRNLANVDQLAAVGIDPGARAETLDPGQFAALAAEVAATEKNELC